MLTIFVTAFLLGVVAGLRTLTAPAALWIVRYGGAVAILLGVAAIAEYIGDVSPRTPARTRPLGLAARLLSGAFCGWQLAAGATPVAAAVAGAAGALAGAYGGLAIRTRLAAAIGNVASGLIEDGVAIAAAFAIVVHV